MRLHELFVDDGYWFFTMELIEGETFVDYVRPTGVLDESRACATALPQLRDGVLGDPRGRGKLHRDLKPSNVLVTADGPRRGARLRAGHRHAALARRATASDAGVAGHAGYMAPEQATAAPSARRADWYASA